MYGKVLKEVLPVPSFLNEALLMEEILQEPQSIKIEIMRMNWEELINT